MYNKKHRLTVSGNKEALKPLPFTGKRSVKTKEIQVFLMFVSLLLFRGYRCHHLDGYKAPVYAVFKAQKLRGNIISLKPSKMGF